MIKYFSAGWVAATISLLVQESTGAKFPFNFLIAIVAMAAGYFIAWLIDNYQICKKGAVSK